MICYQLLSRCNTLHHAASRRMQQWFNINTLCIATHCNILQKCCQKKINHTLQKSPIVVGASFVIENYIFWNRKLHTWREYQRLADSLMMIAFMTTPRLFSTFALFLQKRQSKQLSSRSLLIVGNLYGVAMISRLLKNIRLLCRL